MIQLSRNGVLCAEDLTELKEDYERTRTFRMRNLLEKDMLESILDRLDRCPWKMMEHKKIGMEAAPDDPVLTYSLNFLANRPEFLEIIRRITGAGNIRAFTGRVYRLATSDHYDSWHTDVVGDRLIGMSINLGRAPYTGGLFRLRKFGTDEILCELPNTGAGDAIFFQISDDFEHMVTAVKGTVPKTAFAGWFVGCDWDYHRDVRSLFAAAAATTSTKDSSTR